MAQDQEQIGVGIQRHSFGGAEGRKNGSKEVASPTGRIEPGQQDLRRMALVAAFFIAMSFVIGWLWW